MSRKKFHFTAKLHLKMTCAILDSDWSEKKLMIIIYYFFYLFCEHFSGSPKTSPKTSFSIFLDSKLARSGTLNRSFFEYAQ